MAPTIRLGRTLAERSTRASRRLHLDDYIAQVLAGEGQPKAADAAQQALAITARTFALANRNRHRSEGFDLCDTTHCQVLRPATADHAPRRRMRPAGRVLLHQGQPAFVFYSAWCGGKSELASQVWPGAIDYSVRAAARRRCVRGRAGVGERGPRRGHRARAARRRACADRGCAICACCRATRSERVARIRVEGFTPSEMSGHEFRMAVGRVAGWQSIKSTAFDVDRTSTGYRFKRPRLRPRRRACA